MRKAWPTLTPLHAETLDRDRGSGALVGNDVQRLISRVAEAPAESAREGMGPAGPTPASDREGVVLTS
eukprot:2528638-Pleurochrysis_carterae.AAC.1